MKPRRWQALLTIPAAALFAGAATIGLAPQRPPSVSEWPIERTPAGTDRATIPAPAPAAPPAAAAPRAVRYGRDIRPILSDRCFQCHGPDPATRQAGLRLDVRDEAIAERPAKPGKSSKSDPAIVPGNPSASEMLRRISEKDESLVMPPPVSHKRAITSDERALIEQWIKEGAHYESHWAFIAPTRPPVPAVKNAAWCRNEIDRFVLARLEEEKITPSAEVDPAALVRRVFLDLTGLPPTPEELDAFMAEASKPGTDGKKGLDAAYSNLVDRLFTQEPYKSRYAERMSATWMDQARYADTCGIHMDAGRQMWLWRDWVLDAYRSNMPFDRFVTEQLAGDLLDGATVDQKIATGFSRNHVTTDEGGAIAEEYLVEYAVDRASTTASVFLGLTVGCARCHDHKFDPISTEEFYKLYAFFNSIEEPGLYSQIQDANRAFEPFISVPTTAQKERLSAINVELAALREQQEHRSPEEDSQRTSFLADLLNRAGISWAPSKVTAATSTGGATLEPQPDGSVRAGGKNPERDEHRITLRTEALGLRIISLEAMLEPTAVDGRLGRADNGNAVVSGVEIEAISVADPLIRKPVKLMWAWADHSQQNGDFDVTNVIDAEHQAGWALQGHDKKVPRTALLLADEPFGYEGGTDLVVRVHYNTVYPRHTLARVRFSFGTINDAGIAMLPSASSRWYVTGPFPGEAEKGVYESTFGPEEGDALDFKRNFGAGNQYWRFDEGLADGRVVTLATGRNVSYVAKYIYSPVARKLDLSLGSDDGFKLYVGGVLAAENNVERAVAPDQDKRTIELKPGRNAIVYKIVNTGGAAGYYFKPTEVSEITGDLVAAFAPESARVGDLANRVGRAWRVAFLPSYRETEAKITTIEKETKDINAAVPLTMVMKELPQPRPTFVLTRGQYDKPDKNRPVSRGVPAALGAMPQGAPANRLGLAQWMTDPSNPLLARVTVNHFWETLFGLGIVATSEDFGYQGQWPSHPELLDWLAVEFREKGWDIQHMMKLIVTSATYRQASTIRPELHDRDPDNHLLAFYPRRRLSAEQIRDAALYVSGLLVEKTGGPSVKPYQPEGLWQEVAMPQSNTREYKPGAGDEMWRRSLYTYWKRACPPPSLLTFDAPTREFCTVRRASTSTPLQALVLWNDEQYLEAARVLAQRTLKEQADDSARLSLLFRRCAARQPTETERARLTDALAYFRGRYKTDPSDADGILKAGMAPKPEAADKGELAAWTMIASAVINMYETTTQE